MSALPYLGAGGYSFINLDDLKYVIGNSRVRAGLTLEGVQWAFTTFLASNWHPLTWISHMADVSLFGMDAGWHHRVNVFFHASAAALFFLAFWRMTGKMWESALVAALFGVHPLHVESVAWIAERKDVLCAFFWAAGLAAYARYADCPGIRRYGVVLLLFVLGLLSKSMMVPFPFVLLLMDRWPLDRYARVPAAQLLLEKAPLVILSVAACVATLLAQSGTMPAQYPLYERVANALVSCVAYLGKTAWPAGLSVFYPHPADVAGGTPAWKMAAAAILLSGITGIVIAQRKRRPFLAVGWFWFAGTLVPVIGLVQVGKQAMADRYAYIPLIGIFIMVAWLSGEIVRARPQYRRAAAVAAGIALLALGGAAHVQAGYWKDSLTLYAHGLSVTSNNALLQNNLGAELDHLGRTREAIPHFREALRIQPDYGDAHNNLGLALGTLGDTEGAFFHMREARRCWDSTKSDCKPD
jgi:tetratricopeptide (TPR) repeat protein